MAGSRPRSAPPGSSRNSAPSASEGSSPTTMTRATDAAPPAVAIVSSANALASMARASSASAGRRRVLPAAGAFTGITTVHRAAVEGRCSGGGNEFTPSTASPVLLLGPARSRAKPRQHVAAEHLEELGLVAADVVQVDAV